MKPTLKKIVLSLLALIAAGIAPNLFVISQAGYANLSDLAVQFLVPSGVVLALVLAASWYGGTRDLAHQLMNGILAGLIGTIGLEVIRETGFRLGGMPGELPQLMGVLLLNRFADGPSLVSNLAGWSYHFWNGAAFGIIYSIVFGKGRPWIGALYGLAIGIGFMISPVVVALGVGRFGVDFGWGFPVTVTLAHIAYGTILGFYVSRRSQPGTSIFSVVKRFFSR
jgi:hypothetical protein